MPNVLERPIQPYRFTVADYHAMAAAGILGEDDRVELIDGEIISMPPIGSPHGGRAKRLNQLLNAAVGSRALVAVQDPLVLGERSEPEPDIALLRPRPDFYIDSHPGPADVLLLIEIADTSLAYDLRVKVPLYARHGIPEVWVIDVPHHRALRFTQPDPTAGGYRDETTIDATQPVALPGLGGCVVDLRGVV